MSLVINVTPNLDYRPVWLTGEVDFDVEMTAGHLKQTSTGIRGGAARQFEAEWQWAVDEFIRRMEEKGHIYLGLPPDVQPKDGQVKWREGVIAEGPFLPYDFTTPLPRGGDDNEEIARKGPRSLDDTGGRVCYRMAAVFAVKEHVFRDVVQREQNPERYAAVKNARKRNGLWQPVTPAKKEHYLMGAGV